MEAIRIKDKLFIAVVAPIALAAAYVYFWRTDAVKSVAALEREEAALVEVEDFPMERMRAQRMLAAAKDALTAEKKIPMPAAKVKANPDDSIAARERAVQGVLKLAGLIVERSANVEKEEHAARGVLSRTGFRPSPVCRQYSIVGSYPQVRAALQIFADREMAVIPARVEMASPGRWSFLLWL